LNNVVIFDLDGVITSEGAYWDTAGLVLHELLYSPQYWNIAGSSVYRAPITADECRRVSRDTLPEAVILSFKARSINSNWDTCYAAVCICLIDLLAQLPDPFALFPLRPWDSSWTAIFREALAQVVSPKIINATMFRRLDAPVFRNYVGLELIKLFNIYASEVLGQLVEDVFVYSGPFWLLCQELFQESYLGDDLYQQEYGHAPLQPGKPGCIRFEQPLLPVEELRATLATLREQEYVLGVATGRPSQEAIVPLQKYGLFTFFDPSRVVTHAEVALAEAALRARGNSTTSLGKPNPYQFLVAYDPHSQVSQFPPPGGSFVVVGDTPSDVRGGRAAGAITIAVLTGARTAQARIMLEQSQPDFLVEDVTKVPALLAQIDDLATIQRMQFSERSKAELLLCRWFALHMDLLVESVTLTPKAVSLNSFNGVYRVAGEEYFFKTHVEEQGIVEEYYHAELLYKAGYNIVRPLRTIHQKGQQMVIYPVIHSPVMFDLMRAIEMGNGEQIDVALLAAAEKRECERLLGIYRDTLAWSTAEEHAQAPVHQLFWHRLTGGRLKSFYAGKTLPLPVQAEQRDSVQGLLFEELLHYRWIINGVELAGPLPTLGQMIERAKIVLNPARATMTVIGHGDAHFGNVFLEDREEGARYQYFDPAFAGRHNPILDIVKPFFHNVYATWMYFPREVAQDLQLSVTRSGDSIYVEHNYVLSPVRQAILDTKIAHLLRPLIAMLSERQVLPEDWAEVMRLALMCCPLLTVNLLDSEKRSAAICWLGLTQVMQMGNHPLIGV
jgi:phosphoglycolate phosphatase-like HAD superfamily hydrolase